MAVACVILQLGGRPARAAGTGDDSPASPIDTAASSASSAQELIDRAYELHATGDYAASIAMYLRAYEISGAGVILLNVATIYDRKLHERELAAEYYRRYVRAADAEPELVQKATLRLSALKQEDANPPLPAHPTAAEVSPAVETHSSMSPSFAAPTEAAAADDRATAREREIRTAGIVAGSAGVAGLGASLVLGLLAKGKNDDANALCNGDACSSSEGVHLAHQAGTLATASTVTFCAGLALAGAGLTMILLAPRGPTGTPVRVAFVPSVLPGGGVDIEGAF
jgi:hypothetical protein